jgi:23S rRNA (uridine2552-2'-O)-methyltransferase
MTYRPKDVYHRRARAAGYRARSAYKLAELDRRYRLLRPGDLVLDLGAWPGGWLQVTLERVGPTGRIVGVDIEEIAPFTVANVTLVRGDIRDPATQAGVLQALGRPADVILSDLSPKLTGIRSTDEARRAELAAVVLDLLGCALRKGGRLLTKRFMDPSHEAFLGRLRESFAEVRTTRPEATRKGSAELYTVAIDYRGPER